MACWLAATREGQDSDWIQRFDPRFWTINFPRPMMAALTTTAPDAFRVDAVFLREGDLAGIIWDSVDGFAHEREIPVQWIREHGDGAAPNRFFAMFHLCT